MSINKKIISEPNKSSKRLELIKQIEHERNSKVICYITGDRDSRLPGININTRIGEDIIPLLFRHLELIGKKDNIDLFLYTRGGDMVVPIRIVKLIRNYCKKFSILIPYRAHSAGTLIALGADEIIMTKLGELTPIDPTAERHPFNPRNPSNPKELLPVSVEDVRSYILFAKDELKAKKREITELYSKMTSQSYHDPIHLHPLALGNVYRAQRMIKILAKRLLNLRMDIQSKLSQKIIDKIVNEITSNICVHNYPIYRDEAKSLGLKVAISSDELEKMLWDLYENYAEDMELGKQLNPLETLGQDNSKNIKYGAAYIESINAQDTFYYNIRINKTTTPQASGQPPLPAISLNIAGFAWEKMR
jgi:hypothetical protein